MRKKSVIAFLMQLIFKQTPRYIVAEKPYGLTTHKVDDFKDGFKEFLEQKTGLELAIVSRLDSTTSGLILFPLKTYAPEINSIWQSDECSKSYLFITDRPSEQLPDSFEVHSFIEQSPGEKKWTSDARKTPNAFSHFSKVKSIVASGKALYLWKATIKTGKTHQIRLHAQEKGISILGDTKYDGSPFFRLCLHSHEIKIGSDVHQSISPFESIADRHFPFISEFEKRRRLYDLDGNECFRWYHTESSNALLDQYGDFLFFYTYFGTENKKPSTAQIETLEQAKKTAEWIACYFKKSLFLKPMYDRGKAPSINEILKYDLPSGNWSDEFDAIEWTAVENKLNFKLKSHQGQSPGLFLDQRENRKWVLEHSHNKSVLNLFSYTSGFSVCAASGGATQVTTVDLSKNFLEWSKENFTLNNLSLKPEYEFWSADTLHFLKGAINKKRKWDLIVCDPPTFGRSDRGVFQIEKDFDLLLQNCFHCLNTHGTLLFSTNFEKWSYEQLAALTSRALRSFKFTIERTPYQSLDFDMPNQTPKMKSLFIKKTV